MDAFTNLALTRTPSACCSPKAEAEFSNLVKVVFFPPNIADSTSPPSLSPMANVRHGMFRAATQAFRLRANLDIFHFSFRHFYTPFATV
jgi:hypothetical protein